MPYPTPTEITCKNMRFLIIQSPTEGTLSWHTEGLEEQGLTTLVRVCDATYDQTPIEEAGIQVLAWLFTDGSPSPEEIAENRVNLLKSKFNDEPKGCVAVHCASGLGRSAVLAALALIGCGMKNEDAIQYIRQERRGAFNSKQLRYLEKYLSRMLLACKDANVSCCSVQ